MVRLTHALVLKTKTYQEFSGTSEAIICGEYRDNETSTRKRKLKNPRPIICHGMLESRTCLSYAKFLQQGYGIMDSKKGVFEHESQYPLSSDCMGETKHKIVGAHYTIHVHTTKLSHVSRSIDLTLISDKREIKGEIIEGSFLK